MDENTETRFFETVTESHNENIRPFRSKIFAGTFDARAFFSLNSGIFLRNLIRAEKFPTEPRRQPRSNEIIYLCIRHIALLSTAAAKTITNRPHRFTHTRAEQPHTVRTGTGSSRRTVLALVISRTIPSSVRLFSDRTMNRSPLALDRIRLHARLIVSVAPTKAELKVFRGRGGEI